MINVIGGLVLAAILAAAITYIVKQRKKGVKCIGCPDAGCCSPKNGSCSCGSGIDADEVLELKKETGYYSGLFLRVISKISGGAAG